MKKLIVLSLAGLLILAFGATAYAQAPKLEFRASGFIDMQTFMGKNVPQYMNNPQGQASSWWSAVPGVGIPVFYGTVNPNFTFVPAVGNLGGVGFNKKDSHWEARASLVFDAIMGPNLSGRIAFEIDTFRWGSPWNTTLGSGREANNFGGWTTDRTAVEVKNIYIDIGLPYFGIPVPITVRVGAQPIGVRPQMLVYSDGMGVTAGIKIDPVLIMPIYAKALEGNDFREDDCDVYGLHVNAKLGTLTVGGYGLFYRMNSYPFWVQAPVAGIPTAVIPIVQGTNDAEMWWLGAYLDGKAGPVNLNFDFVYDFGKVQEKPTFFFARDVSYQGWAARGKVEFPWEKFSFGAVGMYATGPDTRSTSPEGRPGQFTNIGTLARRNSGYVVPPGSEQGPGNGESLVVYSMEGGATGGYGLANRANYAGLSPGGFGGTWFAKLFASARLAPWYKVTVQGLYIGDTTHNGNTLGTAFKYTGAVAGIPGILLRDDRKIGWEFNLINEFWIYQNLRFFVGAGYLFAGDALDVGRVYPAFTMNRHIDNPWAVRTRLMYTF